LDEVLKWMEKRKSPAEGSFTADVLKWGYVQVKEEFAKLFSVYLRKEEIP